MARTIFHGPKGVGAIEVQPFTSENTQEMPQSQITSFPGHQKKERLGTNNDKTPHMKPLMHKERRTATEKLPWNDQ